MKTTVCSIFLFLLPAGLVSAQKIKPPSDFKVEVLGVDSFVLTWKDNSDNEAGFQIFATTGDEKPLPSFWTIEGANKTDYLLESDSVPNKTIRFQLAAYQGGEENRTFSKRTPVVTVQTPQRAVFAAAENLKASPINDSTVRLKWNDVSTNEAGYFIEFRRGDEDWQLLGETSVQKRYNLVVSSLRPKTKYSFQVTAYRGTGGRRSPASNTATVRTPPFLPPSRLRVMSEGEGSLSLKWKDNSAIEEGYEVQVATGKKKFKSLGTVQADSRRTAPFDVAYGERHKIRVRAFRTVNGEVEFSKFSKIVSKRALGLARPAKLKVKGKSGDSVELMWKDRSEREDGYTLRYLRKGRKMPTVVDLPADSESYTVTGLKVGRQYRFQVRVYEGKSVSRYSSPANTRIRNQFRSETNFSLTDGVSFYEKLQVTSAGKVKKATISGLPPGVSFDSDELALIGVPTEAGEFTATLRLRFKGDRIKQSLTFRVLAPGEVPEVDGAFADETLSIGGSKIITLADKFEDPNVTQARRFETNLGSFDVILYEEATPLTVANFLRYADDGRYKDTFFHRAPTGFVVQGGGFSYSGSTFGRVDTFEAVQNEPGLSNVTGTIAMAKLGGDPNSATSQFFINLSDDNAANLDAQNGGFTVFGRIAGNGMSVFDEIDALPKGTYNIDFGEGPVGLSDVPVQSSFPAPDSLDPNQLIRVSSVSPSPILTYSATSSDPEIVTVEVDGDSITVIAQSEGVARIEVRATDLDGGFVDEAFTVTVP